MRCSLVWKPSAQQENDSKANERIVIRGYQHPEVTDLKKSWPTLSRLRKMLTLQWAALNRPELERADAKPAFLQDDGQKTQKPEPVRAKTLVCHEDFIRVRGEDGKGRVQTWTCTTQLVALCESTPDSSRTTPDPTKWCVSRRKP